MAAGILASIAPCLHSSSADVAGNAACLVSYLCLVPAQRAAFGSAGIVAGLIGLLQHQDANVHAGAAWALHNLALDCPANQQAILSASGFQALRTLLGSSDGGSSGSSDDQSIATQQARGAAAMALCALAQGNSQLKEAAKAGGAAAAIQQGLSAHDSEMFGVGAEEAIYAALRFLATDDAPSRLVD